MKLFIRLFGIWLLLGCAQHAWSQVAGPKIDRVDIKYVGPVSVSEPFIRSNIHAKAGDIYTPNLTEDDVRSLYGTEQFNNIRISVDQADDGGVILTYIVQVRPRISEINIEGNKKLAASKLQKKITVKAGEPLDEQKLFTDVQEIKKLYEKYGYPDTKAKYELSGNIEDSGLATVTFHIEESPKIFIARIEFIGAAAFTQKELQKQIKTSTRRWYSWMTGSGVFKQDDFDDDKDTMAEFYHNHGYLDFEIKDVKFVHPTPDTMAIQFYVFEGRQYKVGSVKFTGNKTFTDGEILRGLRTVHDYQHSKDKMGAHGLAMDTGDIFTPDGLKKDTQAFEDFYGSKGYLDVAQGQALRIAQIPNVETGTMDLEFQIDEGQKSYVEQINIRGNLKTKDKVIRRELAISPGEVFDMVRVNISKQRLEGLNYFDKVEMQPEPTDPPIAGRENLDVNVEEENTGNFTVGAGFSSVDALVGYAEISQANFDLFHPPTFTGAGQKMRLRVQLGTERQDYELSFTEPWFLNRKLALGIDLYRHDDNFDSPNGIYDETRTGMRLSLTRALWSDFFIGSISYTIEQVGISLNSGWHDEENIEIPSPLPPYESPGFILPNVPQAILEQVGDHFYQRFGATLAYDTRNSVELPNHGQRTELDTEFSAGNTSYYKVEVKSDWFFPGLFKGHVIEAGGRAGIANSISGGDVPFYDRYYLGGIPSLRGFKYRNIGPRDPLYGINPLMVSEPIGGDSYWFGSLEYSIPIFAKENGPDVRLALFYDAGSVGAGSYSFSGSFDDNWGLGLRINIPHLGPLRLDYGVPIHHDQYNSDSGQFQFGVGFTREY